MSPPATRATPPSGASPASLAATSTSLVLVGSVGDSWWFVTGVYPVMCDQPPLTRGSKRSPTPTRAAIRRPGHRSIDGDIDEARAPLWGASTAVLFGPRVLIPRGSCRTGVVPIQRSVTHRHPAEAPMAAREETHRAFPAPPPIARLPGGLNPRRATHQRHDPRSRKTPCRSSR